MASEVELLQEEIKRLRRIVEGDRGDNGLVSRVVKLEGSQSHDDQDRSDRRDLTKGAVLVAAGSAIGQAIEWLWGLAQVKR